MEGKIKQVEKEITLNIKFYVISLRDSLQRRKDAKAQLDKLNINWEIIDAVDGRSLKKMPQEYNPKKVKKLLGFEMTPSELGCFLSHKKIWRLISAERNHAVILEDDFVLSPTILDQLNLTINRMPSYDFLRLQGLVDVKFTKSQEYKNFNISKLLADPLGSSAYLISNVCASRFLKKTNEIFEPLDHFLANTRWHGVEHLAILPYPVKVSDDPSTIIDRGDRLPIRGIRKLVRSYFRVLDRLISKDPWF